MKPKHNYTPNCSEEEKHCIHAKMLKKQEETATMLHQIAQRIVLDIKVKYNYSDSEIKAYLQGCTDTASECGKEHYSGTLPKPNFCDNCGADMRGEKND